jgi:pyruvate kinase
MERLTKIVCTLGPSTDDSKSIKRLIDSGMDFARLNFSHGSWEEHQKRVDIIKKLSNESRKIKIIQDLPGPKLRLGIIDGKIRLKEGAKVKLTNYQSDEKGTIPVIYKELIESVAIGSTILLCDGTIKLKVLEIHSDNLICKVENGGVVVSHKGVNITGLTSKVSAITEEDAKHIKFGVINNVDYIALSFVTKADDITRAKSIIAKEGANIPVIAKIEKEEALENLDGIIEKSDAIMVARGDLAIEIGIENLILAQKRIIKRSNELGKPVITATQMVYSMIKSKTPTRAEVSDIANAILDGTDALMTSEETAMGKYPSQAVEVLSKIAMGIEKEPKVLERLRNRKSPSYELFLGGKKAQTDAIVSPVNRKKE